MDGDARGASAKQVMHSMAVLRSFCCCFIHCLAGVLLLDGDFVCILLVLVIVVPVLLPVVVVVAVVAAVAAAAGGGGGGRVAGGAGGAIFVCIFVVVFVDLLVALFVPFVFRLLVAVVIPQTVCCWGSQCNLTLVASVLVGVVAFLGSQVVLSPPLCVGVVLGSCGSLLGL